MVIRGHCLYISSRMIDEHARKVTIKPKRSCTMDKKNIQCLNTRRNRLHSVFVLLIELLEIMIWGRDQKEFFLKLPSILEFKDKEAHLPL